MIRVENGMFVGSSRPAIQRADTPAQADLRQPANDQPLPLPKILTWLAIAMLSIIIVGWAALGILSQRSWFAMIAPSARISIEAAAALARLFGALVLCMFPSGRQSQRLYWIAAGLLIQGLGGLLFGYFRPVLGITSDQITLTYTWLMINSIAGLLFVAGLVPSHPPQLSSRVIPLSLSVIGALSLIVVLSDGRGILPSILGPSTGPSEFAPLFPWHPTPWYYLLAAVPLLMAIVSAAGASRQYRSGNLGHWLFIGMVLLAGSQFHSMLWPRQGTQTISSADILRLCFAIAIMIAGIYELRRVATDRGRLLIREQEYTRRLEDLATMKADFTAMVVHELGNPLAAIRCWADALASPSMTPTQRSDALALMQTEIDALTRLVSDVQLAAHVERNDFSVTPRSVPVQVLVQQASAYARALPGAHPFSYTISRNALVWADPERIAQVLRNLLSNAAKYTPAGTPIELHVTITNGRACFELIDHGPGIHPGDLVRIFEKFGRGRDAAGHKVPGVGIGLYLSRRLIQAHGADLGVQSQPGQGSAFSFSLEVVG